LGFGLYNELGVSLFQVLALFAVFSELLSPHMLDVLWRMCQVQAIVPCKGACGVSQVGCSQQWLVPSMFHNTMVFMICTMGMWILNNGLVK
jgi:hypothetical protein